jgi:CDP-glycerol glycerophosphotransferase (TagB/SpsB family)
LKKKYGNFDVIETGWPKLDSYGLHKSSYESEKKELLKTYQTDKILLYAPTFSPSLTSAPDLLTDIETLATDTGYLIMVKFHDLMNESLIHTYKALSEKHKNMLFVEEKNIIKFLLLADLLISDTSSVIYEFLLLNKPAISFKTISKNIRWDNLTEKGQLTKSVLSNLKQDLFQEERLALNAMYHPYNDGKSALRMIQAVEEYASNHKIPEHRELTLDRKIKIDTIFGRPINNSWNGVVKNKLSAVFITYNEIIHIDEVLTNVQFADEIIVVDSFSTDGTVERIKKRPNVTLIQRPFVNYTDQKSYAMSLASNDWILFMDADERLTDRLKNEVLKTINGDASAVAYYFYRTFMFKQKVLRFSGWQSDKNFRLFRKSKVAFTKERIVHETLIVDGPIATLKNKLIHFSYKNYEDYKGKMITYGQMKAQEELNKDYDPNAYHFIFRPAYKFLNHYIFRFGFLDGKRGIIISYLNALGVYSRYRELKRLRVIQN